MILAHIREDAQPTLQITDTGHDPVHDNGKMATLPKVKHNTSPLSCPRSFGATFHYDIVYGANTAIGGYPLKSINEEEILCAMKLFVRNISSSLPSKMIAGCDFKLTGGTGHEFLAGVHLDSPGCGAIVIGAHAG
eukprot:9237026-Ditylum_brightwellii.AAC.1